MSASTVAAASDEIVEAARPLIQLVEEVEGRNPGPDDNDRRQRVTAYGERLAETMDTAGLEAVFEYASHVAPTDPRRRRLIMAKAWAGIPAFKAIADRIA